MDAKGRKIFDTLPGAGKDEILRGPLAFSAYNPAVAQALHDLHDAAVAGGTLDPHTRELAILVACRETNYNLEWNGHEASGLKAGLDGRLIDVVRYNRPLAGLQEKDATVIRFGRQMFHDRKVYSATFANAVDSWGKRSTMDMVAVMSAYAVTGKLALTACGSSVTSLPAILTAGMVRASVLRRTDAHRLRYRFRVAIATSETPVLNSHRPGNVERN
jgi:4-carboxymuconolactone decarboxylase